MSDNYSKSSVLRSKLKLKKDNIESTDKDEKTNRVVPDDTCKRNETPTTSVNDKDDSISDFKSPQRVAVSSIKLFTSKTTSLREKRKSKCTQKTNIHKKKETNSKILGQSKKENVNSSQPLIESSFFKPKNNSESKEDERTVAYVCPLCFKSMRNENIHLSHVKSCAVKHNISTKKLLEIIELQQRQAQERKSLGLLAAPVLQDKKKPSTNKNLQADSELQLAIALSKSLHEAEQLNELNEIAVLNETPDKFTTRIGDGVCKKVTLEKLGFTSNRPIVENTINRTKKKKLFGPTVLQTRSQEERNRILTERIAEVLIGNDLLTQKQVQEQHEEDKKIIVLDNSFLQNYHQTEERLWDKASLMPNERNFYVSDLSEHISPSEKQLEEVKKEEDVVENIVNLDNQQYTITSFPKKEQEEKMETENTSPATAGECVKEPFVNTLITDWGNALNNSSASDVIIFVKDNKHIWTHRLVFYVRCPNILLDIVLNNDPKFYSTKEKICWTDVDFKVAFAFLEFIYCGFIKTHTVVFNDPGMLSSIRCLSRKYKVKELFEYLRKVEGECKSKRTSNEIGRTHVAEVVHRDNVSSCEILECDNESVNSSEKLKTHLSRETLTVNLNVTSNVQNNSVVSEKTETITENYLLQNIQNNSIVSGETETKTENYSSQNVYVRQRSVSPDMFDDTSDQMSTNNSMLHTSKDENSDLNMLLNLVNQDLQSSITESDTFKSLKELSSSLAEEHDEKPRRSDECIKQTSEFSKPECSTVSPIVKQKSDISIFIEKIRRQNAKNDSDFDSEIDSPLNVRSKSHGNPFHIQRHNESENFLNPTEESARKMGNLMKKPSALSMLENDVQNIRKNLAENVENSIEIWIDDDKNEVFDTNLKNNESGADNINHCLSQGRIQTERKSRPNLSTSSETLTWNHSFNNDENFEFSTLSLPNQEKSSYTEFENIRRHSSTQSQCKRTPEKHGNVPKSTKSPHKLSQSSPKKNTEKVGARTSMSTSYCINDSVFTTSLGKEDEDTTHSTCNFSKRKKSSDTSSFQNSQCSVRNSLDNSDRRKEVSKSNKSPRKLSQSSLEKGAQDDDAKPNLSSSFGINDSVFSSTNFEKENGDITRNSSKRKKSSDSPTFSNSQRSLRHSLDRSDRRREVSKNNKSPHKLSQSSPEENIQKISAETNLSTSFCINDSVFSGSNLEMENEDITRNSSKRKKSSESPTSPNSQRSLQISLDRSDRRREVTKSNKSPRKLSQISLEESARSDDAKANLSTSFDINDSVFSSTNLEKENEDITHNSSKRKKSSDSPSFRNSQTSLRHSLKTSDKERNSIEEYFHDIVTSDDDEIMEDVSMYTKYKKEHLYNSIADYRAALKEHFRKQKKLSMENINTESEEVDKELHEMSPQNIEDSDNLSTTSTVLLKERAVKDFPEESMDDSRLSFTQELFTQTNRSIENRITLGSPHIYDAETDVENENEDCLRNVRSSSQKFTDFSHVSNDEERNTSTCSRRSADEASFSDKRKTDNTENSGDNVPIDTNYFDDERPVSLSPILISSSPDDAGVEFVNYNEPQTNDNELNYLKPSEDPDDGIDSIFFQDLNLANVNTHRKEYTEPISPSINELQDSPILNRFSNVTSRKRRAGMKDLIDPCSSNSISKRNKSFDLNESNDVLVSPKRDESFRQKHKRTKQLKIKSVSEGNMSMNKSSTEIQDIRRFGSTQCEKTPERNKDTGNKINEVNPLGGRVSRDRKRGIHDEDLYRRYKDIFGDEEVIITDKDVTPPPDYDNMPSPELHKEMKRYGLKLQKRSRAVKLLNYIYNETHPLVPLSNEPHEKQIMISDTEDKSPIAGKSSQQNLDDDDEDCDMLSQNSATSGGYINPGEIDFEDPEPGPSTSDNPKSVGEAFVKLLKGDRDLHNRILMYEPINLMEVHATLKANGFKCNVNAVMDYLDEQCITFCIPENSVRNRTRKNKK